jgi:hypothetical protein
MEPAAAILRRTLGWRALGNTLVKEQFYRITES